MRFIQSKGPRTHMYYQQWAMTQPDGIILIFSAHCTTKGDKQTKMKTLKTRCSTIKINISNRRWEQCIKLRCACSVCIQILVMTDHNTEASECIMWYGHISLHIYVFWKLASVVTVMHRCKPLKLCTPQKLQTCNSISGTYVPEGLPGLTTETTFGTSFGSPFLSSFSNQSVTKGNTPQFTETWLKQIQLGYVAIKDLIRILGRMWSRLQNYQGVNEMSPASGWKSTASLGPSTMSVTPVIW